MNIYKRSVSDIFNSIFVLHGILLIKCYKTTGSTQQYFLKRIECIFIEIAVKSNIFLVQYIISYFLFQNMVGVFLKWVKTMNSFSKRGSYNLLFSLETQNLKPQN